MKIADLINALGGVADFTYVPVKLVCEGIEFNVKIKKQMSVADAEFIYRDKSDFEDSHSIRSVHRMVLFVSEGVDERPTMQQVTDFPIALINVLGLAIQEVQSKQNVEAKPPKKNSRPRRNSGKK